jgi:serine/threonine-protein kinase
MAFEMFIGRPPFMADSAMDIIAMHMTVPPPRARASRAGLPEELADLVDRALDKDPGGRPSLSEWRAAIARARAEGRASERIEAGTSLPAQAALAPAAETAPPVRRPARRRALALAALAGLLVAAAAAALWWWNQRGSARPVASAEQAPGMATEAATEAATGAATGAEIAAVPPTPPPAPDQAPPASGALDVRTGVSGAEIAVGDQMVRADDSGHARIPVAAGSHEITVSAPGRAPFADTVEVAGGETVRIPVRLAPAAKPPRKKKPRGKQKAPPPASSAKGSLFDSRN